MSSIRQTGNDGPSNIHVAQSRLNGAVSDVPVASRPHLSTLLPDEGEPPPPESWATPPVSETYSPIPEYVQIIQTESGHTIEYDNTPGYERIAHTHASGSFQEFQANGSHQLNIRGDNYKLVAKNDSVYIVGKCNLSVDGDMNTLVKGNYNLEVVGDYSETIHGNKQTKISLSSYAEIGENQATLIGKDHVITVINDRTDKVNGNVEGEYAQAYDSTVVGDRLELTHKRHTINSAHQLTLRSTEGNIQLNSDKTVHAKTPILKAQGDVIAGSGNVSVITHLHTQTKGDTYGAGVNVLAPIGGTPPGS